MREESSKPGPNLPFLLDLYNFLPQILHWSKTGCIQFCTCCAFLLFCWATRNVFLFHVYVICPSPTKAPTSGRYSDPFRSDGSPLLSSSPRPRVFPTLNHIFRGSVPHQSGVPPGQICLRSLLSLPPQPRACERVCSATLLCPTLCNPMDCSPPGSSVHGIIQERLEWVAMPSSRASSQPRDRTQVSCLAGRFFTTTPPRKPRRQ